MHHVAKKFTNSISFPNSLDEINFSSFNKESVSNIGTFLSNKVDGSSDGFLSIISK
ncbi:uncharacterized protein METZ01_LOCUS443310 [marine metagenome]|uniref:Uncharacterized protein n=1 Tax=marine metagenome TaxID=408172 RepID=A0A382Z4N0_9ZZZZ